MRPYALLYLYRNRLRVYGAQELLAGLGIAAAVALIFAVTVANSSIAGSAGEVVHTVVGPASIELSARDSEGYSESLLKSVERLPGVKRAAPLLEASATIVVGARQATVELVGTDISLAILDGLAHRLPIATLNQQGVGLSKTSADELGLAAAQAQAAVAPDITVELDGDTYHLKLTDVLGTETAGALSKARAGVMPLSELQRLTHLRKRISRIFVQTLPGRESAVRSELATLAHGTLTVAPADQDLALLHQALSPNDLATKVFAAISALLGFLFAFNAMLLTVPERRKEIADLRLGGTKRSAIVEMVTFEALCLGVAASVVGLLIGYALSVGIFHQSEGYLSQAFILGGGTVVETKFVVLSVAAGVLATCLACAIPLLDLRRGRPLDAVYLDTGVPGNALGRKTQLRLALGAVGLLAVATALFALRPALALVACVVLALATVLAVPLIFAGTLRVGRFLARGNQSLTTLPVALTSLKATTLRSLALAATGGVALFGSVALGGARGDLLRGVENYIHAYASGANIWVVNTQDSAAVRVVPSAYGTSIAHIPGVSAVRTFQNAYLDVGNRRVWILARPSGTSQRLVSSEIVEGPNNAAALMDKGGWIIVSKQIAVERHAHLGGRLLLPTPTGNAAFKIAATTTNLGWSPGTVLMSSSDYRRFWGSPPPTALAVELKPGARIGRVQQAIGRVIASTSALEALTPAARANKAIAVAREGLGQLAEISTLLVIAAILALGAALTSAIWQRRVSLAALRLGGAEPTRLRRILAMEALLMLLAACVTGTIVGIYAQLVLDRYLKDVTGFPVASLGASWRPLEILALVVAVGLAIAAIPAWIASRVPPAVALQDE